MAQSLLIDDLKGFGDLKVWSVLVTLLGDLASAPMASLSGPVVSRIMTNLDIKPEALRVAIHRLRKDGWITSQREGRISRYSLTETARRDTLAVQSYVYDAALTPPDTLFLVTCEHDVPSDVPCVRLHARTILSEDPFPEALNAPVDAAALPDWIKSRLTSADMNKAYASLLSLLAAHPEQISTDDPELALSQRVMILHTWRRIALRHEPLAARLMGQDWVGAQCRNAVAKALTALPRTLLDDLA